ncbi:MAG: hypothetical protein Q9209_004779 [Squamulea sp. 1 TL-2023]
MRAATERRNTNMLSAIDPSTSAQKMVTESIAGSHARIQSSNPIPSAKEAITETRPPHLRNFFAGPPTNLPSSTAPRASNRPIYDNHVPGIPTHWIPIYGAGHGIFYDPMTKLFYGDGPPRPDLERSDDSMPEMDTMEPLPRLGEHREDVLHIQPRAVTDPIVRRMQEKPIVGRRWYCKCQGKWLDQRHDCPDDRVPPGIPWSGGVSPAMMAAIRPGDKISIDSFTHDLAIGDLDYLTPTQRHACYNSTSIPRGPNIA